MDLSNLDLTIGANEGSLLSIVHPVTGDKMMFKDKPVSISLLGQDSDQYRQVSQRLAKQQLSRRGKPDIDRLTEDAIEILVAVTTGWYGLEESGQPIEFSADNARRIYKKYVWLRQQVDEFVGERANFFKA